VLAEKSLWGFRGHIILMAITSLAIEWKSLARASTKWTKRECLGRSRFSDSGSGDRSATMRKKIPREEKRGKPMSKRELKKLNEWVRSLFDRHLPAIEEPRAQ
jgi:hypothetical protein